METGVRMAEELIDSGAALKKLEEFIQATTKAEHAAKPPYIYFCLAEEIAEIHVV